MKLTNVILLLTFIAPPAFAQPPDPGIPILRGVVTTANDVPLARVRVGVAGAPASERGVLTNDRGEFAIRLPDAGSSRLSFTKAGYAGHTAAITRAQLTEPRDVRVRLLRGGAISGHVVDQSGAPAMMANVALRRVGGTETSDAAGETVTNDLGEFRQAQWGRVGIGDGHKRCAKAVVRRLTLGEGQSQDVTLRVIRR